MALDKRKADTLYASLVGGVVPISQGGTGQSTANAALNALLPSQAGNAGFVLTTNGANTSRLANGSGTVTSVSVVTNQGVSGVVATATTTPAITLSLGVLTGVTSVNGLIITANTGVITTGTWNGTTISIANGGTGQTTQTNAFDALSPTTTKGDLIVHDGTDNVRQGVGANGSLLVADSTQATGVRYGVGAALNGLATNRTHTAVGNATVTAADFILVINKTVAAATTVDFPAGFTGAFFYVVDGKGDAATNNITFDPNGAQTINGQATQVLSINYGSVGFAWNGTERNML